MIHGTLKYRSLNLAFCYVIIAWQEPVPGTRAEATLVLASFCRRFDIFN